MTTADDDAHAARSGHAARRDRGITYVEMLVSIVLLGVIVVGVLAAMRSTIIASRAERDHAAAQQWLQSAIQRLEDTAYEGCDNPPFGPDELNVRLTYEAAVRDPAIAPSPSWDPVTQLSIVNPIKFWNGETYEDGNLPANCLDNNGFLLQLVTLRVRSPDGAIIEEVSVVKGDD